MILLYVQGKYICNEGFWSVSAFAIRCRCSVAIWHEMSNGSWTWKTIRGLLIPNLCWFSTFSGRRHLVLLWAGSSYRRKPERRFNSETLRTQQVWPRCLGPFQPHLGTLGWISGRLIGPPLSSSALAVGPDKSFSFRRQKQKPFFSLSQRWPLPKSWGSFSFFSFFFATFLFHCCTIFQFLWQASPLDYFFCLFSSAVIHPVPHVCCRTSAAAPQSGI